jgi:outer membrane protein OmpA-like peptidoglycan-associated protein
VARRTSGDRTLHVGIIIARDQNLYLVDELTSAAMATGTVSLNLDTMRSAIEESGKIAVYDIHFATGSAVIEPTSADALAVIATYLAGTTGGYYVVGHTDDTGSLEANLALSQQRAAAVKAALVTDHGVAAGRLETRGVGPLAPVATNTGDAGRALNRRVEVVQRLRP